MQTLPMVLIFDNDDLAMLFRRLAEFRNGKPSFVAEPVPEWLRALLDEQQRFYRSTDAAAAADSPIIPRCSRLWCDAKASATASERNPRYSPVLRYWH